MDYIYSIVDMDNYGTPTTTVNLFKTEEKYRKYMIDIMKENNCLPEDYEDMTTDDIEYEFEENVSEQNIDGRFEIVSKSSIIDRG